MVYIILYNYMARLYTKELCHDGQIDIRSTVADLIKGIVSRLVLILYKSDWSTTVE